MMVVKEAWLMSASDVLVRPTRIGTVLDMGDGRWNLQLAAMPIGGGVIQLRDPVVNVERDHVVVKSVGGKWLTNGEAVAVVDEMLKDEET